VDHVDTECERESKGTIIYNSIFEIVCLIHNDFTIIEVFYLCLDRCSQVYSRKKSNLKSNTQTINRIGDVK
jgi:hypothetical protein